MDLQPYSHDRFSKISRTLFDFRQNTYGASLFLEKQLANILDRGVLFLGNTLFFYSLSPYRWTASQTENEYTRFAWAGGTFFPVVLLCQFFVLAGNRFWFYILLMYLEFHTVVVLC